MLRTVAIQMPRISRGIVGGTSAEGADRVEQEVTIEKAAKSAQGRHVVSMPEDHQTGRFVATSKFPKYSPGSDATPVGWRTLVEALRRPYPITLPMVALMLLVPAYVFIGGYVANGTVYRPEIALDRALPLQPFWSLVYGALYVFLIVLPVVVVRQEDHIRRTFWAYLSVWLFAYAVFLAYPTAAPRPATVAGEGFAVWGLLALYGADPPFNCFPSLHVAHSFISALTCYRVHRELGITATIAASLVAISTLFTKQHYVLDVLAGVALACAAYAVFLRNYPRDKVPALDRRVAPFLAVCVGAIALTGVLGFWMVYRFLPHLFP